MVGASERHALWRWSLGLAPLLLLATLLPSLLYLDHWSDYLGYTLYRAEHAQSAGTEHVHHHTHCHFGPASCAGQAAPLTGRVLSPIIDVPQPDLPTVSLEAGGPDMETVYLTPPTEPPQL